MELDFRACEWCKKQKKSCRINKLRKKPTTSEKVRKIRREKDSLVEEEACTTSEEAET